MRKSLRSIVAAVALVASFAAHAQDIRTAALPKDDIDRYASITGITSAPMGWRGFCEEYASECDVPALDPAIVTLTDANWKLLVRVNRRVNRAIEPVTDEDHWGVAESWNYPDDGRGDCEDYALLKRRQLIAAGLPRQALLMTVVRDNHGEGHAILTVVTDKGDLVLDNKRDRILAWKETGFSFIKRQSMRHPSEWVSIGDPEATTATAAH